MLELVKQRQTLICFMGITLYGAGYGIFHTTIPVFLLQEEAFSAVDIGVFFSLLYVAISISQAITGPLKGTISGTYYLFWGVGMFFGPLIMTRIAISISFQASMAGYSFLILLVAGGMMKMLGWKSADRE